jgi:hypothetical protein
MFPFHGGYIWMVFSEDVNQEKLAEIALVIISLASFKDGIGVRAWKGMDWDLLAVLHEKGWIGDPVGKQKSVVFTDKGQELATTFMEKHFGK